MSTSAIGSISIEESTSPEFAAEFARKRLLIAREEAYVTILEMASRSRGLPIPGELATHLILADEEADWPVLVAAMRAALARWRAAADEGLVVASRPKGRSPFGGYTVRVPGARPRPYRQLFEGILPMRASCDCQDFIKNSLGLCKHLFAILADLVANPRTWSLVNSENVNELEAPRLRWQSMRPLAGVLDGLAALLRSAALTKTHE